MFSSRTPKDLTPNRLAEAVKAVRREGRTIIDLTESNPTRAGFDYPHDLLRLLADCRGLKYTPSPFGLREAREAVARDFARRGFRVTPERIALTASTSEAYAWLFKLLTDADDEVLVPRPSYPLFDHLATLEHVAPRTYHLDCDAGWRIDFDSLDSMTTARTRAIVVVSPNNPTGSFLKTDELRRLAETAEAHDLALIADEVFADYELTTGARDAAGHAMEACDVLSFSLGGLSKTIGLPQTKLAWVAVSGPDRLVDPAVERLEIIADTYLSVSTPVQVAAAELLDRGAPIREQIAARVSANYATLKEKVAAVPACRLLVSEGGWSAVVQVPSFGSEEALVLQLLEEESVLVHPGYFFDFARESYLVVSLLVIEGQFGAAIDRILGRFDTQGPRP